MKKNPFKGFSTPSQVSENTNKRWKKRIFLGFLVFVGAKLYTQNYNIDLEFVMKNTAKNKEIIKHCKELKDGFFKPTFYLPNALTQIIYGAKIDSVPYVPFNRELFKLKDKGQIALDWGPVHKIFENDDHDKMRILLIAHGLTGGSETNYIRHAVLRASRAGFRPVVFHNRGVNSELTTEKYHCNASIEDISEVLNHLKEKYPEAPIYGMGISIGANLLINYAGKKKNDCILQGIVSIANPFDLLACSIDIAKWNKKLYNWNLTNGFKKNLKNNLNYLEHNVKTLNIDIENALKCKTTRQYDEYITRRLFGYKTVEDYYKILGCKEWVKDIEIPVLFINSKDDPICSYKNIPTDVIKEKDNLILVLTPRGGHIDWLVSIPPTRWVYYPALQYLLYIDKLNKAKNLEIES